MKHSFRYLAVETILATIATVRLELDEDILERSVKYFDF